ncbi:protein of unknown function [Kyrpidia spormannii]|uniref:Uncharacterized protein n=1 Tax=Kyrpidia spormannii TaxID=2055160 RepID=A0ACA8ZCZ2_9BACL|nr:protein of unknown function [Kyrpidia spormannii]
MAGRLRSLAQSKTAQSRGEVRGSGARGSGILKDLGVCSDIGGWDPEAIPFPPAPSPDLTRPIHGRAQGCTPVCPGKSRRRPGWLMRPDPSPAGSRTTPINTPKKTTSMRLPFPIGPPPPRLVLGLVCAEAGKRGLCSHGTGTQTTPTLSAIMEEKQTELAAADVQRIARRGRGDPCTGDAVQGSSTIRMVKRAKR